MKWKNFLRSLYETWLNNMPWGFFIYYINEIQIEKQTIIALRANNMIIL